MTIVRFNAIRLAVAVVVFCACSFAQDQNSNDAHAEAEFERLCSFDRMFTPYDVGSDFSVNLSFRQTPLPGIRVVLTPTGDEELADAGKPRRAPVAAVTDSSGTAHFLAVPAGKYDASAKNGLFFPSNEVTVHAEGDYDRGIAIEWPLDSRGLLVRALRGKLIAPGEAAGADRPLQQAAVKLLDLRSSRVIETTRTLDDGSYQFSTIEPGIYAVRVIPPAKVKKTEPASGDVAVELDPAAHESTIPEIEVQQSECAGVQLLRRTAKDNSEAP
jgi:hypothetical protein